MKQMFDNIDDKVSIEAEKIHQHLRELIKTNIKQIFQYSEDNLNNIKQQLLSNNILNDINFAEIN